MEFKEKTLTTLNDTPIKVLVDTRLKETQGLIYKVSYMNGENVIAVNIGQTNQINGEKRPKMHVNDLKDLSAVWLAKNESKVSYVKIELLEVIEQRSDKKEMTKALENRESFYNIESIKNGILPLNDFKIEGRRVNAKALMAIRELAFC